MTDSRAEASRTRNAGRAIAELAVIFIGVTAAFLVEGYRELLDERQQLQQATEGILVELGRYQVRNVEHADAITASIERWRSADQAGSQAVPGYYRIRGAPYPPTAAWDAAVSTGVAGMFDPELRLRLGYFYSEQRGIHDNYIRYLDFIERVTLPTAAGGAAAFYDASGELRPEFRVQMTLLADFGEDLRNLSQQAATLEAWIRTGEPE